MIDLDAFEERAAIMEFDGGLSRFRAETLAAQAQGKRRDEVINEIRKRNSLRQRDHGSEMAGQQRPNHMPGMQPTQAQEDRPVSERHTQG
ncbi:hypothetical protein J7400_18925 [Shimia sp. R9_2]|uniref:hypothetical protein n=1 Tax=Shimia sp. R9_2 TaxID=2821112 RepID=UPI001ADB2F3E|nr:hypothetical protein [Shimia sp. R9_2]MBO9398751.1 hypothetical protein [Shimia sp. R9_2]